MESFLHFHNPLGQCHSLLPSSDRPFGFLNPFHAYILDHTEPLTSTNWLLDFGLPLFPLVIQTYLLQFENTRSWRIAAGILGLMVLTNALTKYRFEGEFCVPFYVMLVIKALNDEWDLQRTLV